MIQVKFDEHGLVPAIVQDAITNQVMMLAYMNEESLQLTIQHRETWFYSRSRHELWHKGATSGHTQKVESIRYDCDQDTLLIFVNPTGPACHTGETSCFFNEINLKETVPHDERFSLTQVKRIADRFEILAKLESIIASRDRDRPAGAYTTYLFEKGIDKILKKVGEEAAEVIIAAKNHSHDELRYEASDLIFHLLVLLQEAKLPLDDVLNELASRHVQK